jgi:DNA repair exonuclease SbcCD ATPase subunit
MAQRDAHQATKRKPPGKASARPAAKSSTKTAAKPGANAARPIADKGVRETSKAAKAKLGESGDLTGAVERLEAEVKSLRIERDTLTKELEAARGQISELESAQTDAINRIDWVIDSLHNLMEQKN